MPYRHWFVVLTSDGVQYRSGPYASRRIAERKAREHHKHASNSAVEIVYDPPPPERRDRH
jgi:hypothetical protein